MNALSDQVRIGIEQKIALGWSDDGIARLLKVSPGSVCRVRLHLDSIRDMDVWGTYTHRAGVRAGDHCSKGLHTFTDDNTYRRPNGRRECRACKDERNRARYMVGVAA